MRDQSCRSTTGRRVFRHAEPGGDPRGIFCGMGICYDCLVTVAGQDHVRISEVAHGLREAQANRIVASIRVADPHQADTSREAPPQLVSQGGHQMTSPNRLICSYVNTGPSAQT